MRSVRPIIGDVKFDHVVKLMSARFITPVNVPLL